MTCPKCETILIITPMSGTATAYDLLGLQSNIDDLDQLPWVPRSSKNGFDLWLDPGTNTLDDGGSDADDVSALIPQNLGRVMFSKVKDDDGECASETQGGSGICVSHGTLRQGHAEVEIGWEWDSSRFHLGLSQGSLIYTSCIGRSDDSVEITTPAAFWTSLTKNASEGSHRVKSEKCGVAEKWRFSITDSDIAADRAGIVDAYFDVTIGLEGCCRFLIAGD